MHLKVLSGKWRPFCLGLNVLNIAPCRSVMKAGIRLQLVRVVIKFRCTTVYMKMSIDSMIKRVHASSKVNSYIKYEGDPLNIKCCRVVMKAEWTDALLWCHNECNGIWNHQRLDGLLNCLFRRRSKKTSKLRITGLCEGNSPVTGEFPSQRASNTNNVSIWWRHHDRRTDRLCRAWKYPSVQMGRG